MTADLRRVLDAHRPVVIDYEGQIGCSCGDPGDGLADYDGKHYAAHLADVLQAVTDRAAADAAREAADAVLAVVRDDRAGDVERIAATIDMQRIVEAGGVDPAALVGHVLAQVDRLAAAGRGGGRAATNECRHPNASGTVGAFKDGTTWCPDCGRVVEKPIVCPVCGCTPATQGCASPYHAAPGTDEGRAAARYRAAVSAERTLTESDQDAIHSLLNGEGANSCVGCPGTVDWHAPNCSFLRDLHDLAAADAAPGTDEGRPVQGCMVCATYRGENRACPEHRNAAPGTDEGGNAYAPTPYTCPACGWSTKSVEHEQHTCPEAKP